MNILRWDQPFVSLIVLLCNSKLEPTSLATRDVATNSQNRSVRRNLYV